MNAQKQQQIEQDIHKWTDLWFADDKKAGFVALANEEYKNIGFYGNNDYNRMEQLTNGIEDRYLSLNAFEVDDWGNTSKTRSTVNLKQIRTIGIDIDQYNHGLTIPEAMEEINKLIRNDEIPVPNLVLKSNGIQLFYSIKGGLSPYRSGASAYITKQLIKKMQHIGADGNAKDVARLMRVPNSINSRNGATVHAEVWNNYSFTLWDLRRYVPKYEPKEINNKNIVIPINSATDYMNKTNRARIHDFDKLMKLREYDLTGRRNATLYNYAFHLALIEKDLRKVMSKTESAFAKVKTTDPKAKPFDETEIYNTSKSAYDDADKFIKWYQERNFELTYEKNDGVIKPKKTTTLIDELEVTRGEQQHLKTLVTDEMALLNKRKREKNRITKKRREQGIRPMNEYQDERKLKQKDRINQLEYLIHKYPNYTQQQYADLINVSRRTISNWMKSLR